MDLHILCSSIVDATAAMQPISFDGSMTGVTPNGDKEDDRFRKMIKKYELPF